MKKNIFKGFHRPIGLPAFLSPMGCLVAYKSFSVERLVRFHDNCAYDLHSDKQYDWNKLFGFCLDIIGIHKNSIRFGWRYSLSKNRIELCTIIYDNGTPKRVYIPNHDVPLNCEVDLRIEFDLDSGNRLWIKFLINNKSVYDYCLENVPCLCYFGCGLYFGGKSRAPHKISVDIRKM